MANKKISELTSYSTPVSADVLPINDTANNLTKKVTIANLFNILSSLFTIKDSSDTTKKVAFDVSGVTTATTRTLTVPNASTTIVGTDVAQTLSSKTLGTGTKMALGSDATGDIYYNSGSGTVARLPISTDGKILKLSSGLPSWQSETVTNNASTTVAGIVEEATQAEMSAGTAAGGTGARLFVNPSTLYNRIKFGGTGADGALTVTSGNTNIDLGGAAVFVKNYTSISITGTGSITFINPHTNGSYIVIKSQGDVTLTSSAAPMIDASGCGGAGGAGGASGTSTAGSNISGNFLIYGSAAGGASGTASADAGGGTAPTNSSYYGFALRATTLGHERFPVLLIPGAGGSGGSSNNATPNGGSGGNGGGALYIECAGAWNFTTSNGISVVGKNGSNGTSSANRNGGGGGGGCGTCLVLYNTLTANSGTINVTTSSGGSNNAGAGTAYAGGGGASLGNNGAGGNGAGAGGGAGGAAITNAALVLQNTSIA